MTIAAWVHQSLETLRVFRSGAAKVHNSGTSPSAWTTRDTRILTGLLLFNGVGAVGGGIALLIGKIGLPLRLLEGTPFTTYTIPGWILLVLVGGSSLVASVVVWRHMRLAAETTLAAGAILLGWIAIEFVMIPEAWIPQLVYFVLSITIVWFGGKLYRRSATWWSMQA